MHTALRDQHATVRQQRRGPICACTLGERSRRKLKDCVWGSQDLGSTAAVLKGAADDQHTAVTKSDPYVAEAIRERPGLMEGAVARSQLEGPSLTGRCVLKHQHTTIRQDHRSGRSVEVEVAVRSRGAE